MKDLYLLFVILFVFFSCHENKQPTSQSSSAEPPKHTSTGLPCNCPSASRKPQALADSIFFLSNEIAIGLCGDKKYNEALKQVSFSAFELFNCGDNEVLAKGGGSFQNSKLTLIGDTLVLTDSPMLPTGENFAGIETVWSIEKIYFDQGKVKRSKTLNRNIREYNEKELQVVRQSYEALFASNVNLDEITERLLARLFVAALSGDKKSRTYFFDLPNKFEGLDGAYKALYHDYKEKLADWEKN